MGPHALPSQISSEVSSIGARLLECTRILLLRHAETADPSRFHGSESNIGLGERGQRQALAVARYLANEKPDAIVTSAMSRAIDTAKPIAEACGIEYLVEADLHERSMGPLSGVSREDGLPAYADAVQQWTQGNLDYTHTGGESYIMIQRRVMPVFDRVVSACRGKTIVIVAHGVVIRVLLTTILPGSSPLDFKSFAIDNTAINDLRLDA